MKKIIFIVLGAMLITGALLAASENGALLTASENGSLNGYTNIQNDSSAPLVFSVKFTNKAGDRLYGHSILVGQGDSSMEEYIEGTDITIFPGEKAYFKLTCNFAITDQDFDYDIGRLLGIETNAGLHDQVFSVYYQGGFQATPVSTPHFINYYANSIWEHSITSTNLSIPTINIVAN